MISLHCAAVWGSLLWAGTTPGTADAKRIHSPPHACSALHIAAPIYHSFGPGFRDQTWRPAQHLSAAGRLLPPRGQARVEVSKVGSKSPRTCYPGNSFQWLSFGHCFPVVTWKGCSICMEAASSGKLCLPRCDPPGMVNQFCK